MAEVAVITTVFAPAGTDAEQAALRSTANTRRHFPDAERWAALDLASPVLHDALVADGWGVARIKGGKPPRMTRLLATALGVVTVPVVWTVEMDAFIEPGARQIAEAMLAECGSIAAVECRALDPRGRDTEPTHQRVLQSPPWRGDPKTRECTGVSFNCTCWRRAALQDVDWAALPMLVKADTPLCDQLIPKRWTFLVSREATCVHLRRTAQRAFAEWRRTHAPDKP